MSFQSVFFIRTVLKPIFMSVILPVKRAAALLLLGCLVQSPGCGPFSKTLAIQDIEGHFPQNTIVSAQSGSPVSFDRMMSDLALARVIYIGEKHTRRAHHEIQIRVIQALYARFPDLVVGMEMFDRSYQEVLDQWSSGQLDEETFLKKTHWRANWKYDFGLYREILEFIRDNRIPLRALNIPFHIPPKIAVSGLEHLNPDERKYLPEQIDASDAEHRKFVEEIFGRHAGAEGDFENFYMAQCVWEEAMAEAVAQAVDGRVMAVLVGNGHIIKKFGIPNRAFRHTGLPYRTVYPVQADDRDVERSFADYLWVVEGGSRPPHMRPALSKPAVASAPADRVEPSENQTSNQLHLEKPQ